MGTQGEATSESQPAQRLSDLELDQLRAAIGRGEDPSSAELVARLFVTLDELRAAGPGYRTAPCSVCHRYMRVKADGTIGHHGGDRTGGHYGRYRTWSCEGVGRPPADVAGVR